MAFFDRPPLEFCSGPRPQHALVWLHGLGADGHDFADLIQSLADLSAESIRFIFPHAPLRPVTLNGGAVMPAWFDLFGITPHDPQDQTGLTRAAGAIAELIEHEHQRGIAPQKVILGGFSQGGALALHVGLTGAQRLGALVAWSTYLPLAERFAQACRHPRIPLFMAHGTEDTMVPFDFGTRSRDVIRAAGGHPYFKSYPIGHSVADEEIVDLRSFLTPILQGPVLGARSTSG
ncbi:MAG: dienelactone hydrolase family protein [Gammaproteobacteria bacterium]|nr:dienelactone hydrolase family protein [Gammaproteobacteria bacterium]